MRQISTIIFTLLSVTAMMAQGWPSQYKGVMLQGFYWDSYTDTQWANLESQADELAEFFNLIWIPQSGKSANYPNNSMGYDDLYWFTDYTNSFGNEDQLRSMISTFKAKGLGTIADVVINHRASLADTWMSFPVETYNGITYEMLPSDICANDDGGNTATNAETKPTGANDSGDDFDGARDIDHSSQNVQTMVKAYLDMLLNDFGYTGFRYDMVKGYAPKYTGMYNTDANPEYSVGEYWDGNASSVINWIDGTKVNGVIQSAAFDFPLKYHLRDCCNAGTNWNRLENASLAGNTTYSRYAVTFVDNHDTYGRGNDGEIKNNILAANAFILAAPGTPCVFLPHWKEYKADIKQMIYARKAAGISNESSYEKLNRAAGQYAIKVNGDNDKSVVVLMGNKTWPVMKPTANDYYLVKSGDNFAYYLSKNAETAWTDIPSGTYDNAVSVTLSAISTTDNAQLVYTLNGSDPTSSSTKATSGQKINIDGNTTLKVGLLIGGQVTGIITRTYTIKPFVPHDITVYVSTKWVAENPGWKDMNVWSWGGDGTHATSNPEWPGDKVTNKKTVNGEEWYYMTYRMNSSDDNVCLVFSTGNGTPQTVDINNINTDKYFRISGYKTGEKHNVDDVTGEITSGIADITINDRTVTSDMNVYTVDGRLIRRAANGETINDITKKLKRGLYIIGGKKVIIR